MNEARKAGQVPADALEAFRNAGPGLRLWVLTILGAAPQGESIGTIAAALVEADKSIQQAHGRADLLQHLEAARAVLVHAMETCEGVRA